MKDFSDYARLCQFIGKRFVQDNIPYRAAALTITSLLSIVPMMVVAFAIFSAFPVFQSFGVEIQRFIFANMVPASGEVLQSYLASFMQQTAKLPALGMLFLILTAVLMLFTVEEAFNVIWRVRQRRKGVGAFLMYWAILTLSPVLIGLSLVASSYIVSLPLITDAAKFFGLYQSLLTLTAFALFFLALTLLYLALPNCSVKFRYGAIGAFIAALLFEAAKLGFTWYISFFPTYQLLYGTLSVIPIFILWVYLSWMIVLFGAMISYTLTFRKAIRKSLKLDGFSHSLLWLYELSKGRTQKRPILSLHTLVHRDAHAYAEEPEQVISHLVAAGWVQPVDSGYMLMTALEDISLSTVQQRLPWSLPRAAQIKGYDEPWLQQLHAIVQQTESVCEPILDTEVAQIFRHSSSLREQSVK